MPIQVTVPADESKPAENTVEEVPSVEIPTAVTVVGDEGEGKDEDVIKENVKPEKKPETDTSKPETSESGDTSSDSDNTLSGGNTSSGGSGSSGGNTSSGGENTSSDSGNTSSGGGNTPTDEGTSQPVHRHTWEPVYGTRHVENLVTTHEHQGQFICNCGYTTCDMNAMKEHAKEHILAGTADNYRTGECPHTTTVDQGYDETYVEYYECTGCHKHKSA